MKKMIKIILSVFYLSWGILFGLIAANFPKVTNPGTFFQKWGLLVLMSTAIFCPVGILAFGWLKKASKAPIIWLCIFSILGTAFWFLFSAFITGWVAIGGDG